MPAPFFYVTATAARRRGFTKSARICLVMLPANLTVRLSASSAVTVPSPNMVGKSDRLPCTRSRSKPAMQAQLQRTSIACLVGATDCRATVPEFEEW